MLKPSGGGIYRFLFYFLLITFLLAVAFAMADRPAI